MHLADTGAHDNKVTFVCKGGELVEMRMADYSLVTMHRAALELKATHIIKRVEQRKSDMLFRWAVFDARTMVASGGTVTYAPPKEFWAETIDPAAMYALAKGAG